jgi:hypothetical protein
MTLSQLVARYESGAIASQEFVVESLNLLDPADPSAVLRGLPTEILTRLRDFVDEYRPGQMLTSQGGRVPSPEQVEAARGWLDRASSVGPRLTAASSGPVSKVTDR